MAAALVRILAELVFFLALALISEAARCIAARRGAAGTAGTLRISSLVCGWYSVSITLTLFNKWIVSSWRSGGLDYPIFYTMTHMVMKGCFSFTYLLCVRRKALPKVGLRIVLGSAVIGAMTAADVAASNLSFIYISVTFFVMLKSASLVFILAVGTLTCIERCTVRIFGAVVIISGGIFLASYGEAEFNLFGFCLVLMSEVFAALRWVVTQMVLHGGKLDSMQAVFFMAPASATSLVPLVWALELHKVDALSDAGTGVQYLLMVLFPGFLSFILLLVEVQLVKETSSLTLSVFGNLKSVVTILLAILLFGEKATPLQWLGLSIALCGMLAYSTAKRQQMQVDALAALAYEALPELSDDEDDQSWVLPWAAATPGGASDAAAPAEVVGRPVDSPDPGQSCAARAQAAAPAEVDAHHGAGRGAAPPEAVAHDGAAAPGGGAASSGVCGGSRRPSTPSAEPRGGAPAERAEALDAEPRRLGVGDAGSDSSGVRPPSPEPRPSGEEHAEDPGSGAPPYGRLRDSGAAPTRGDAAPSEPRSALLDGADARGDAPPSELLDGGAPMRTAVPPSEPYGPLLDGAAAPAPTRSDTPPSHGPGGVALAATSGDAPPSELLGPLPDGAVLRAPTNSDAPPSEPHGALPDGGGALAPTRGDAPP